MREADNDAIKSWEVKRFFYNLPLPTKLSMSATPYLKDHSVHIIPYIYTCTKPIATKLFNYKDVVEDLNIDNFKFKPSDPTCASSQFIYKPTDHGITNDQNIISYTSQVNFVLSKPDTRLLYMWPCSIGVVKIEVNLLQHSSRR